MWLCVLQIKRDIQQCKSKLEQKVLNLFFLPDQPTDPPSQETGQWETKHFIGMALGMTGITRDH